MNRRAAGFEAARDMQPGIGRKLVLLLAILAPVLAAVGYLYPVLTDPNVVDRHPELNPSSARERTPESLRVLFIGNSFTFGNGGQSLILQRLVESARAREPGLKPVIVERATSPGASLEDLWRWGGPQRRIREGHWDYVVLQDHSQQGLTEKLRAVMFEYVRRFGAEAERVGARPVLFMTWPLKKRPQDLAVIAAGYEQAGRAIGATVVPVGRAWLESIRLRPSLNLYDIDDKHASGAGSYLTACLFYSLFYARSPAGLTGTVADRGITFIELPDAEAAFLQGVAARVMGVESPTAAPTASGDGKSERSAAWTGAVK